MASNSKIEYRGIEGFPGYRVGDDGSVWTAWAYNGHQSRKLSSDWKRMKPQPDGDGYLALSLFREGKSHRRKVHLLVLAAFTGPRPDGLEGCHNNGILSDCNTSNLRWDTHANNQQDRITHGTAPRGTRSGKAKLSDIAVIAIRAAISAGVRKKDLAVEYGVSPSTISAVARGANWAWLKQA